MKTMKCASYALAVLIPLSGCANPSATFKIRVVDDVGEPLSGVRANVYNIFDYGDFNPGFTDSKGLYSIHLNKVFEVGGSFEKLGYYKSRGVFWLAPKMGDVPPGVRLIYVDGSRNFFWKHKKTSCKPSKLVL